jgi:hypothetical protein
MDVKETGKCVYVPGLCDSVRVACGDGTLVYFRGVSWIAERLLSLVTRIKETWVPTFWNLSTSYVSRLWFICYSVCNTLLPKYTIDTLSTVHLWFLWRGSNHWINLLYWLDRTGQPKDSFLTSLKYCGSETEDASLLFQFWRLPWKLGYSTSKHIFFCFGLVYLVSLKKRKASGKCKERIR